jgi:hypothetical protein
MRGGPETATAQLVRPLYTYDPHGRHSGTGRRKELAFAAKLIVGCLAEPMHRALISDD